MLGDLLKIQEWPDNSGADDHGRGEMLGVAHKHGYSMRMMPGTTDRMIGTHGSGAVLALSDKGGFSHFNPGMAGGKTGAGAKELDAHLTRYHGKKS